MTKTSMYRFLLSLLLICFLQTVAISKSTFISLLSGNTEVMYLLGAQDSLLAVSTTCYYPREATQKIRVGDSYYANLEEIVKLKPDYLLSFYTSKPLLAGIEKTHTKVLYFEYNKINDIYKNITTLGKLTGKEKKALELNNSIKSRIASAKTSHPKKVLYLLQMEPYISIGKSSFISDVIKASGQNSVTASLNLYYPSLSPEFIVKSNPDIIVLGFPGNLKTLKRLCPKAKLVVIDDYMRDVINRPGPRVAESVEFFANL